MIVRVRICMHARDTDRGNRMHMHVRVSQIFHAPEALHDGMNEVLTKGTASFKKSNKQQ